MRFPLLALLAFVAMAQDPASETPTDGVPETSAPAEAPVLPTAPAPRTGGQLLADATVALAEQRFEESLKIAIPAITMHPELAGSFEALALLATDQLGRQASVARVAPPQEPRAAQPYPAEVYGPPAPSYPVRGVGLPGPQGAQYYPYERRRAHFGVDLGLPTSLRVEWKARREDAVVTGGGLRFGVNILSYYGLYGGLDLVGYADFGVVEDWEVEVVAGLSAYSGFYPIPVVGAALQYDPEGPLQVNVGGRIGIYRALGPDVGVGFLW